MKSYNIKINGKEYSVSVQETTNGQPPIASVVAAAPIVKPTTEQKATPITSGQGTPVTAPMPGTILRIKTNGKSIRKGEPILVLEAMKMENEIAAPCDGMVTVIVQEGTKVNSGDVIARIE